MVEVKNFRLIKALYRKSPFEAFEKKPLTLDHLKIFGFTVYILIHKDEQKGNKSKSAKFALHTKKNIPVRYHDDTIYQVYLEKNSVIICTKDLRIHEDAILKDATILLTYKAIIAKNLEQKRKFNQCSSVIPLKSTRCGRPTTN